MTGKVRIRAIVAGILLGLGICAVTPYNNAYLSATPLAGGHFPLAPFFILIWLTLAVAAVGKLTRREPVFNGLELLTIWVLMVVVSGIAYTGLVRTFLVNVTAPHYFATSGNRWAEILGPFLPNAWYPADKAAIETLYNGLPHGRAMGMGEVMAGIHWGSWLPVLLTWVSFVLLAYLVMLCLVNLFSRQWIVNERVNFPLLRVPLVMAEAFDEGQINRFFLNRFLLIGVGMSVLLHTINGLSFYYPTVPQMPNLILAGSYFPKFGFLSGFHKLKLYIFPAFIGFAFLTTRQISFSFWFFFIMAGLATGALATFGLQVPDAALGVVFGPTMARPEEAQVIGAIVIFFLFIIWLARYHLKEVAIDTFSFKGGRRRQGEWIPARYSLWGFILGFGLLVIWSGSFGMPILVALVTLAAFFIFMLVASRVVCQGGVPYFTLTAAPTDSILAGFGPRFFGGIGILMAAVMQKVLFVDLRESLMPSLFHGAKVSERTGGRSLIFWGICISLLLAVGVSFISMLFLAHKYGLRELDLEWATRTTITMYDNVTRLTTMGDEPRFWVLTFAGVGAAVMAGLVLCYQRFYWWPIHPIGYLLAYSSAMRILWFCFFLGWLANYLCLHYGGAALFKKVRYFFFGLIIGDFLMGGFWALVGIFTGASYQVLPV